MRSFLLTLAAGCTAFGLAGGASAQSFAAHTVHTSTPSKSASHDADNDKKITATIHDGFMTVDGMVAKVHLDYDIHDATYLYFFIPGEGTAIVSRNNMPNSYFVKQPFNGSTFTIPVNNHTVQVTTDGRFEDELHHTGVYIHIDTNASRLNRYPMMGFGNSTAEPFQWPGSRMETEKEAHYVAPPPVPVSLLPKYASNAAPATPTPKQ